MAFIETAEKVSCFKVMDGHGAICWTGHPTQACQIDYRDGKTCIKWPVQTELSCVKDSNEMLNTGNKCQFSFSTENKNVRFFIYISEYLFLL